MTTKILIVDDEPLARERIREMLHDDADVEIVGEAADGYEAQKMIHARAPDLVFLDVQMPEMNGFEMLESLAIKQTVLPLIIFVTAYDQHALRAFEFHALDYLLKPFDRERFGKALRYAKEQLAQAAFSGQSQRVLDLLERLKGGNEYLERLTIKNGERIIFVRADDVRWVEAEGNYVRLNTTGGSHMIRNTLNNLERQLDPRTFVRINRSTIINLNAVRELHTWERGEYHVLMQDGTNLTLTRNYRERFESLIKGKV